MTAASNYHGSRISVRDLLAFILQPHSAHRAGQAEIRWRWPLQPGLYEIKRSWTYVVIPAKGNCFAFRRDGRWMASTSLKGLDLKDCIWKEEAVSLADVEINRHGGLSSMLPKDTLEKARKPRPFSPILAGHYGGGSVGEAWLDCRSRSESFQCEITIEKDGSVRYFHGYAVYWFEDDSGRFGEPCSNKGDEQFSQVTHVTGGNCWSLTLKPGPDAHGEAAASYWKTEQNSTWVNTPPGLSTCTYNAPLVSRESALLSSTRISYHGLVQPEEGVECIVSFPGKYPDGWLGCVQGSQDMSVPCVFLCGKEDGLGQHATDPEDGTKCYCHKIHGLSPPRKCKQYGYDSQEACDENEGRPFWGCLWFERWRKNVELAVERRQKLIVYFFEGQVGQGLVQWEDLPGAELWDGQGLGGSQKGEVAFLKKMGYEFEMRDVAVFLKDFAPVRVD